MSSRHQLACFGKDRDNDMRSVDVGVQGHEIFLRLTANGGTRTSTDDRVGLTARRKALLVGEGFFFSRVRVSRSCIYSGLRCNQWVKYCLW
jgi:hypothetical protein